MDQFIFILEILGTCAFAMSGAILGIFKQLDIFGVIFCGIITSLGGGVIRDMMLGNLPPVMFRNYIYAILAIIFSIVVFMIAKFRKTTFETDAQRMDSLINIFDAMGLGVFTIIGIDTAISSGYASNAFFTIFLGMTTGCGGGILRDIIVREIPMVFTKRIYAIASIVGGILYYFLFLYVHAPKSLSAVIAIISIFVLRICATVFRWHLPKAY